MSNTPESVLLQYYEGKKLALDWHNLNDLRTMTMLIEKSYIDNNGQITLSGIVRMFMDIFNIQYLDVLALAFVASKPVNASRSQFADLAWEFNITKKSVQSMFNRLCNTKMINNLGLAVFAVSNPGKQALKKHMSSLYRIDRQRDELFKAET